MSSAFAISNKVNLFKPIETQQCNVQAYTQLSKFDIHSQWLGIVHLYIHNKYLVCVACQSIPELNQPGRIAHIERGTLESLGRITQHGTFQYMPCFTSFSSPEKLLEKRNMHPIQMNKRETIKLPFQPNLSSEALSHYFWIIISLSILVRTSKTCDMCKTITRCHKWIHFAARPLPNFWWQSRRFP